MIICVACALDDMFLQIRNNFAPVVHCFVMDLYRFKQESKQGKVKKQHVFKDVCVINEESNGSCNFGAIFKFSKIIPSVNP